MLIRLLVLAGFVLAAKDTLVLAWMKDGSIKEMTATAASIKVGARTIPLASILSVHSGEAAIESEAARITKGIEAIQGANRKASDAAVEDLTTLGVPVISPLLAAYKDTDQHEPRPLYRLFERIMPVNADGLDRGLSIVRLAGGEIVRGKIEGFALNANVKFAELRGFAVRQKEVVRKITVHSIQHSTQIEFFDTAVIPSATAKATSTASGFTRLSWAEDGWATDPDGLKVPGPKYKTNLVDGHPFGALVGRGGAKGAVYLVGMKWSSDGLPLERLQLAINDNRHWQNNLGSYRVTLRVSDAYDVGEAQ
jgi:hypothetical protein